MFNSLAPFSLVKKTRSNPLTIGIWWQWERLTGPRQTTRQATRVKIGFNRLSSDQLAVGKPDPRQHVMTLRATCANNIVPTLRTETKLCLFSIPAKSRRSRGSKSSSPPSVSSTSPLNFSDKFKSIMLHRCSKNCSLSVAF